VDSRKQALSGGGYGGDPNAIDVDIYAQHLDTNEMPMAKQWKSNIVTKLTSNLPHL